MLTNTGGRFIHDGMGADKLRGQAFAADSEVVISPLGLGAIVSVLGYQDLSQSVFLFAHRTLFSSWGIGVIGL